MSGVTNGQGVSAVDPSTGYTFTNPTFTGAIKGVSYEWAHYAIPVIALSSGTMGNNGALSAITALGTIYANAYVVLPAGAIAAGVPAATDIYFCQFSSTTAGTIFNNRLADNLDSKGGPTIPASPTAFATTGPGAFTGVTATTAALTLTIPAGTLASTAEFWLEMETTQTNNANAKTVVATFGGAAWQNNSVASAPSSLHLGKAKNRSASVQSLYATFGSAHGVAYGTVNTANAVAVVIQLGHSGAATDNVILESLMATILTP